MGVSDVSRSDRKGGEEITGSEGRRTPGNAYYKNDGPYENDVEDGKKTTTEDE